ncbi:MAG: FISUMP domain-containing protein [bacterium]
MKVITIILAFFCLSNIFAQNTNPVVTNITYNEINTDGTVDIYYDVYDAEQNSVNITLYASLDGGISYGYADYFPIACTKATGDVGDNVSIGTGKHIIWHPLLEYTTLYVSGVVLKIKIIADDQMPGGSPCPGMDSVEYGGKTYHTVLINEYCWLKENLNIGSRILGTSEQENNGIIEKYCYDNDEANCDKYGGLYEWAEAVQYQNGATNSVSPNPMFTGNVQGICPAGWHIPSKDEFKQF